MGALLGSGPKAETDERYRAEAEPARVRDDADEEPSTGARAGQSCPGSGEQRGRCGGQAEWAAATGARLREEDLQGAAAASDGRGAKQQQASSDASRAKRARRSGEGGA